MAKTKVKTVVKKKAKVAKKPPGRPAKENAKITVATRVTPRVLALLDKYAEKKKTDRSTLIRILCRKYVDMKEEESEIDADDE